MADTNCIDRDGDINPFWKDEYYTLMASDIRSSVREIKKLFNQWMDTVYIDIKSKDNIIACLFNDQNRLDKSLFLTFSFTETLELVYEVSPYAVNHIHGLRRRAADYYHEDSPYKRALGDLIIGHGNDFKALNLPEHYDAEQILDETIIELRKDTDKVLRENINFWSAIFHSNIDKIYSFGFSYSDVDLPYIERICEVLNYRNNNHLGSGVAWYLNSFDERDSGNGNIINSYFEEKIRHCGFQGTFGRF